MTLWAGRRRGCCTYRRDDTDVVIGVLIGRQEDKVATILFSGIERIKADHQWLPRVPVCLGYSDWARARCKELTNHNRLITDDLSLRGAKLKPFARI